MIVLVTQLYGHLPKFDYYTSLFFKVLFTARYRWWFCSFFSAVMLYFSNSGLDLNKALWGLLLLFSLWKNIFPSQNQNDKIIK
jgi:hypothetical protein